jgi:CheY-like chemotaxis protein
MLEQLDRSPGLRGVPVLVACAPEDRVASVLSGAVVTVDPGADDVELARAVEAVARWVRVPTRRVLVLGGDEGARKELAGLIAGADVELHVAASAEEAMAPLADGSLDCVVALPEDGKLPAALAEAGRMLPVLLLAEENGHGEPLETPDLPVRVVPSRDRLIEQLDRVLHRGDMRARRRADPALNRGFAGRTVMIVDDDIRNIFALTCVLERFGMEIVSAENGRDALGLLRLRSDIDAVLMDIMMPDLDGYETTRAIRTMPGREDLPVIALTAKAMKGDREKCLEAGASAYLAKPVQTEKLLSVLGPFLLQTSQDLEVSHAG